MLISTHLADCILLLAPLPVDGGVTLSLFKFGLLFLRKHHDGVVETYLVDRGRAGVVETYLPNLRHV